ncbi:exodeoxyribonuclease VII large subunit [Pacificimonas flava]|uniref:Exodeoxyribonuclease 7 large subunit n=1 Tax=Pacificimonas flava TaxID=1234595 RepID=M2SAI6_9SPHN|nr:exodeoxyribonuclease VII large subunit [Pacificimonas flava]EMD82350.1 Exodeoxyribonuclease VII large subunit [Pacificimonas flava]MBB5280744.1 exodeoxyribonuclease VII large subunit [Pacificimonas flava]
MASIPGLDPGAPGPSGAGGDSGGNAYEFTVGELSIELKRAVEDRFGHVRLRGEISGWKTPASGHAYFTLKDEDACIDAVMWRTSRARLDFAPEDGLEVIAQGRVTTYPGRSKYQIVVERMAVAGAGALMALLEKRKAALGAEGLFAPERKRALPFLPRRIGIVTSPTGAVIRDMLHRLEERFPRNVLLWPVKVQGEGAAGEVARGIAGLNALPDAPDLIIVARGGGSIEDLWAFNEEAVVRAVAASGIPVISAVGHETDTTLCDFAADHRAPTPTAAAERAVPVRAELAALIADQAARLDGAMRQGQRACAERAAMLAARLPAPATLIEARQQRLDDLAARLPGPKTIFDMRAERLAALEDRLRRAGMQARRDAARDLQRVSARLGPDLLQRSWLRHDQRLKDTCRVLASLDPRRPLQRGFALVEGPGGRPVTSAARAGELASLMLRFSDGALSVRTAAGSDPDDPSGGSGPGEPNSAQRERPKRTKAPKPAPPGQPDLF